MATAGVKSKAVKQHTSYLRRLNNLRENLIQQESRNMRRAVQRMRNDAHKPHGNNINTSLSVQETLQQRHHRLKREFEEKQLKRIRLLTRPCLTPLQGQPFIKGHQRADDTNALKPKVENDNNNVEKQRQRISQLKHSIIREQTSRRNILKGKSLATLRAILQKQSKPNRTHSFIQHMSMYKKNQQGIYQPTTSMKNAKSVSPTLRPENELESSSSLMLKPAIKQKLPPLATTDFKSDIAYLRSLRHQPISESTEDGNDTIMDKNESDGYMVPVSSPIQWENDNDSSKQENSCASCLFCKHPDLMENLKLSTLNFQEEVRDGQRFLLVKFPDVLDVAKNSSLGTKMKVRFHDDIITDCE